MPVCDPGSQSREAIRLPSIRQVRPSWEWSTRYPYPSAHGRNVDSGAGGEGVRLRPRAPSPAAGGPRYSPRVVSVRLRLRSLGSSLRTINPLRQWQRQHRQYYSRLMNNRSCQLGSGRECPQKGCPARSEQTSPPRVWSNAAIQAPRFCLLVLNQLSTRLESSDSCSGDNSQEAVAYL